MGALVSFNRLQINRSAAAPRRIGRDFGSARRHPAGISSLRHL